MLDTCPACGAYRHEPAFDVDEHGSVVVCGCGDRRHFRRGPLYVIGGPSGGGKTTVLRRLAGTRDDLVLLESDVLWSDAFAAEPRAFFDQWLRVCRDVSQAGRPVALFGAGFAVPANLEPRAHRGWFSAVYYLALVADDAHIEQRLLARPAWRKGADAVAPHLAFARWLRENGPTHAPTIDLVDTSGRTVDASVGEVSAWLDARR